VCCACSAMPLDESDSHVNVNCVFVGVFSCSSKLTFPGPFGGVESAAAFAIAVEIIPWSDLPGGSPAVVSECSSGSMSKYLAVNRHGD
jgi:hypothetical protein